MQNGLVSKHNAMDPQNPIYFCDRQVVFTELERVPLMATIKQNKQKWRLEIASCPKPRNKQENFCPVNYYW